MVHLLGGSRNNILVFIWCLFFAKIYLKYDPQKDEYVHVLIISTDPLKGLPLSDVEDGWKVGDGQTVSLDDKRFCVMLYRLEEDEILRIDLALQ